MQWTKTVVAGSHHVEVDLTYEGGRRTSWTGTVVIAGDAQTRLENALRNVTVHGHASGSMLLLVRSRGRGPSSWSWPRSHCGGAAGPDALSTIRLFDR